MARTFQCHRLYPESARSGEVELVSPKNGVSYRLPESAGVFRRPSGLPSEQ